MNERNLSRSSTLAAKLMYATFQVLRDAGGEMVGREVINEVVKSVELDDWASERYQRSGYIRWQSILHFYTINCKKAGFMVKKGGVWYITPEGETQYANDEMPAHFGVEDFIAGWAGG